MDQKRTSITREITACGVMTAVLCVLAPVAIPVGPVPVTLATLAVYLIACLLGWKWGSACCGTYLVAGLVGLPVFSGYGGGAGALLGPTGGYLLGYVPMALIAGWVMEKTKRRWLWVLGMAAGTAVCYAMGTGWYCWQSGTALGPALALCVLPFLPFDGVKILAVTMLGPFARQRLREALAR